MDIQDQSGINPRTWSLLAFVLIFLMLPACLYWMAEHPFAIHSDEAWYVAEAQVDLHTYQQSGLHQAVHGIVHGDPSRPPAYRLISLPLLILFGYHIVLLRVANFLFFLLAAGFIYLAVNRIAGPSGAALAALLFFFSPTTLQACICFGTEGPLYLAIAATLYFASVYWSDAPEPRGNWVGLGLAIGLGCLSKTTFGIVIGPALLLSLFFAIRNRKGLSGLFSLLKAGALGLVIAIPWWRVNFVAALGLAKYASRGFPRHSLGSHSSLLPYVLWIEGVFLSLIGPATSILIAIVVFVCLRSVWIKKDSLLSSFQRTAILVCVCSIFPLIAIQLSGINFLLRHISPTLVPLCIAIGILAESVGWTHRRIPLFASGFLVFTQFLILIFPVLFPNSHPLGPGTLNGYPWRVMMRFEQWDWQPVQQLSQSCQFVPSGSPEENAKRAYSGLTQYGWNSAFARPKIGFLGNGRAFNGSQMQFPWLNQGAAWPDVSWLWMYESGPIDWPRVMAETEKNDLVVTAPQYVGELTDRQDQDNQYNAEFASRLSQDPLFDAPIHFRMGNLDPVDVVVFTKKSLNCNESQLSRASNRQ